MLRSLSLFSLFKPTQNRSLQFIASLSSPLNLTTRAKRPSATRGSISDVLQILGPIHLFFPNSELCLYIRLLKKCIRSNDSFKGSVIHAHVLKSGVYNSDLVVCNVLLDMYAKTGSFRTCMKLFDEMPEKDAVSFCTLISGFSNHGFHHEAFHLFKSMLYNNHKPNGFIISSILKTCALSGSSKLLLTIHSLVIKTGHGFDPFIEIGFVNSYSKCGNISDAHKLFEEMPVKTTIAWNTIISGYVQNGHLLKSLNLFKQMYKIGLLMDIITLRIISFCASTLGLLQFCKNIHVYAIKLKLSHDNYFALDLIKILKNSGEIEYMKNIFCKVKKPDPSLCSSFIYALNLNKCREESIILLKKLIYLKPDLKEGDFVNLLNLSLTKKECEQIHSFALKTAHFSYISVSNAIISIYFKLGHINYAYRTFEKIKNRDLVTWTGVITGLVQFNEFNKALYIFNKFRKSGIRIDEYCLSAALNACTGVMDLKSGKQIHVLGLKSGFGFSDFLIASFINMYSKCGQIGDFMKLYYDFKDKKNSVLINVVLSGFCNNFYPQNALELFIKELELGFVPDQYTYSIILNACTDLKAIKFGDQIHSKVLKSGFKNTDIIIQNSLINLFIKCDKNILNAKKIFKEIKFKNENSYALLMLGHMKNGENIEALKLFSEMQENGIFGNYFIFSKILEGCADVAALDLGKQVHASIIKIGLIKDVYIEKAIVGLYAKLDLFQGVKRENVGVFMLEDEKKNKLGNYENTPEFGKNCNYNLVDLLNLGNINKKEGGIGEEFLKFQISNQVFLVANLGFLRKQNSNLGFVGR